MFHTRITRLLPFLLLLTCDATMHAQIDFRNRNLLQLGYDLPLMERGPRAAYLYYYYSNTVRKDGDEGTHCVGLLFQYDFEQHLKKKCASPNR